ncbi:YheC/YheD family endospore coat-associated protein [Bacillus massilinigeriensis]|uniref:YheC/YheD family endospore coat-associated protein n=1 Tax=Bacillus mediterraneensis TaxID=1805474 RepID=UPI0008F89AC9|nr:YheC/YheD family protein [Bacillus mediterraneensis]
MITFGILSLQPGSENQYFTEIATRSSLFGMECYRFIPSNIDPITNRAAGELFDVQRQEWIQADFPIPEILYDRCIYIGDHHSKRNLAIVKWLKNLNSTLFLGNGLPGKWSLYKALAVSSLRPYVPETKKSDTAYGVLSFLSKNKKIILKPIFGHAGSGIVTLEEKKEAITVSADTREGFLQSTFPNRHAAEQWIEKHIISRPYLMQPFLVLTDNRNRPMDIRIFLQKDEYGRWRERGRAIRTGRDNGILSNLAAGGSIQNFREWEKDLSPFSRNFLSSEMDLLVSSLTKILEDSFLPLFELGIDIGVGKDLSLWILDVNSKPGRKVVEITNEEIKDALYKAPLAYGRLLVDQKKRKENGLEKTLSARDE